MALKLGGPAPKVGALARGVPPALGSLVDQLLARKPDVRPGCAAEVIASLDHITRTMPSGRPWRGAAVGMAAIAAVVGLARISHRPALAQASARSLAIDTAAERATPALQRSTPPSVVTPVIVPADQTLPVSPVPTHLAFTVHARAAVPHEPAHIVDLVVAGSLSPSVVRRAVDRVLPALRHCADRVGERLVVASFAIGETRRANGLQVAGAGASCLAAALASVRTEVAPELGDVRVQVTVAF